MKSRHTQSRSQQNEPTVVATMHVKPVWHCVLADDVSPSEQSSSLEQPAVHSGPMPGCLSPAGRRQMRVGHSTASPLNSAVVPVPVAPPSEVSRPQTRPMCLSSQPPATNPKRTTPTMAKANEATDAFERGREENVMGTPCPGGRRPRPV